MSEPSLVSFKSDWSMEQPIRFTAECRNDQSTEMSPAGPKKNETGVSMEERDCFSAQESQMSTSLGEKEFHKIFKAHLKDRFQRLSDGLQRHGLLTLLSDVYTELYIMQGGSGEVNNEHEVRQIEISTRMHQSEEETAIKCNDIFKALPGQDGPIRTVLTQGVAGIGKTVCVQKFILDWAEGRANQHIDFIFPLSFRELNLMSEKLSSLEALVHNFFPHIKEMMFTDLETQNVVFIFDGLDECRLLLDFQNEVPEHDVTGMTSVKALLTNLVKGNLLPKALIWITSRPAAAGQIPPECVSQLTEIRGFNDPQKEEYFKKKINDPEMANKVIGHLKKASRSLYIMCHIPVFCWISATVLENMLREAGDTVIPKTLTQMYTHFLVIQASVSKKKYVRTQHVDKEMILKLGRLAFKQLLRGNLIFYEEDLRDCGIDVSDALEYSGVCTQIFREELELLCCKGKVFCFVHLSIQEHLAALYVHVTFCEEKRAELWNPLKQPMELSCSSLANLHKAAVDKALQIQNGQFDLFLRFLLGLSLESNQALLQVLLPHRSAFGPQTIGKTIEYIKIRLRMNLSPEKYINLFHCLNELNDFSLEEEIQNILRTRNLTRLSTSQWAALVFVLLTSGSTLEIFDPWKYAISKTEECLWRMLPVVSASRTANIRNFNLTNEGFQALASAISSKTTSLRELNLSGKALTHRGLEILTEGLKSPHCKLEKLEFSGCKLNRKHLTILGSALKSNLSHLRELKLNFNRLLDYGLLELSHVLWNPHCRLEKLKLVGCELTGKSCEYLAAALSTKSSLLELDLSKNPVEDSGVAKLSNRLETGCKLRVLRLADCGITKHGCRWLCKALESNPSHLRELCLNRNRLLDEGVSVISGYLESQQCQLKKLSLSFCDVSEEGCAALARALELNPSYLRTLDLTGNKPGSSAKERLTALQHHRDFRLEKLSL